MTPDQVWESNGFQYVRGNSLRYVDPDGHRACWKQQEVAYGSSCDAKYEVHGELSRGMVYAAGIAFLSAAGEVAIEVLPTGRARQAARMVEMGVDAKKADRMTRAAVAANRKPGLVARLWSKARNKGPGEWVWKERGARGMDYQSVLGGTPVRMRADGVLEVLEYRINGVHFDDFVDGVPIDYKDYTHLLDRRTGGFKELPFLERDILQAAWTQLDTVDGPIAWSVPTNQQVREFQKVLGKAADDNAELSRITVVAGQP